MPVITATRSLEISSLLNKNRIFSPNDKTDSTVDCLKTLNSARSSTNFPSPTVKKRYHRRKSEIEIQAIINARDLKSREMA